MKKNNTFDIDKSLVHITFEDGDGKYSVQRDFKINPCKSGSWVTDLDERIKDHSKVWNVAQKTIQFDDPGAA